MNARTFLSLAVAVGFGAPAHAIPVTATAVADASLTILINDGELVAGVRITDALLGINVNADSTLAAPDAVSTPGGSTVINGVDADNPSVYIRSDSTTRNGGTEGGAANVSYSVYGVRLFNPDQVIGNQLLEVGAWGTSQSSAQITTQPYDTSASADAPNGDRVFTFENLGPTEAFFTIAGDVEVSAGVLFNGAASLARAFADARLLFDSADPLDISFSALAPYLPEEDVSGDNASNTLARFTDPDGLGQVGLTASASALGVDAIASETASVLATDSFLLGVTLQPGQAMTMTRRFSIQSMVEIEPSAAVVPAPGVMALLTIGLTGLLAVRRRQSQR
jgi:hypothetical protein